MKTYFANKENTEHQTYIADADGQILGRLAVKVASVLRGKHKPTYTPHADCGDMVIITNADKIRVTGGKETKKIYKRYTGYSSGQRTITYEKLKERAPEQILRLAVNRMLPQGALGNKMRSKLRVYAGAEHPHTAQKPIPLEV